MRAEDETIETLARAILRDAKDEADQIQSDGREKAEAIRKRAEQQAEQERREILEHARQEAERLRGQVVANAQLKARTQQLEFREKLLERGFQAARERLPSLQKRSDYEKIAAFLLREAVTQLNAREAIVRADAATQRKLDGAMDELAKDLEFRPSSLEPLKQGLGVIVESADGHVTYDNTLETRLDRLKNSLRSPVYQVLMGEKL
jgi:V/A-type H+-transporting ATPase subunit E